MEDRAKGNYMCMCHHISCNQNVEHSYVSVLVSGNDSYNAVKSFALDLSVY